MAGLLRRGSPTSAFATSGVWGTGRRTRGMGRGRTEARLLINLTL